jgi:SAM-dependent methyltransferase
MSNSPLADVVSSQYARYVYPQPILDLPTWLTNNWQWFDPSHSHRLFWPDRDYKTGMAILVAGCGTNQAAVIAFTNPQAKVVALDVSRPSLDHHQFLKNKHQLHNLELRHLPIEDVSQLCRDFDLIISTGVLHHMASPQTGMNVLAHCLRPDGVIAIMLYAKYGRLGVDMLQSVFKGMNLGQNDASVLMVREALAALPNDHPVKSYLTIAPDLNYDAGLVDTFLHGRERNYTIPECLDLVDSAELVFQDLLFKAPYSPPSSSTNPFLASVAQLDTAQQWAIMEQVNFRNGCHFFTACRADRPESTYKIDFQDAQALSYVPALRHRCALNGHHLSRPGWSMPLDALQQQAALLIDGQRTLAQIAQALLVGQAPTFSNRSEAEKFTLDWCRSLWLGDFVSIGWSS